MKFCSFWFTKKFFCKVKINIVTIYNIPAFYFGGKNQNFVSSTRAFSQKSWLIHKNQILQSHSEISKHPWHKKITNKWKIKNTNKDYEILPHSDFQKLWGENWNKKFHLLPCAFLVEKSRFHQVYQDSFSKFSTFEALVALENCQSMKN